MDALVRPGRIVGRIRVPGSKSIAQRALILATRRGGWVRNVPASGDLDRLCNGLRALGFELEEKPNGLLGARDIHVGGGFHDEPASLDMGDNGTGARCLTALAALRPVATTIDGTPRLRERPLQPLCEALRALGAEVEGDSFPVTVRGPLRGETVKLSTEISSQFATALVLIVDRVKGLRVNVTGKKSFSYVGLTAFVQRGFQTPYDVEPDWGSAAALAVGAATTRGDLYLDGLSLSSPQPDARVVPHLNRAGARVTADDGAVRIVGGKLRGVRADLANAPDLAPVLGALGALAEGETRVVGAPHLIHKESDRIASTVGLIRAMGGEASPLEDGFVVQGGRTLRGGVVSACDDHRIAMAAGVLALSTPGVTVAGSEAVAKSYPGFFQDLDDLTE